MSTSRPWSRSVSLIAAATAAALTLTACSNDSDSEDPDTRAPEITSTETPPSEPEQTGPETDTETDSGTETDTATVTSTRSETASSSPKSSTTAASTKSSSKKTAAGTADATSTSGKKQETDSLEEVRERFSTLAPEEFFDQFDDCAAGGLSGSFDCSGEGIGQFQFFDSDSKAASTTQLLTELRSSRVVEDNGDRVVGWSTLGTSAIITVVDNEAGQVMQQLISTDQEDPRQRIYDLGLAKQ
ncbi:hypothetical protein NUW87_09750 [Corynebacterium pilbarense]|uniref:Beta-N-acetylglucosaminidase n=1 Tax=Corynebacterium pilbarense TaxID=1288393 RepID=A0A9Q4IIW1_9CORY|nr:hypothetical protein [Corynebacterium pilbarense]MCZ2221654.1 hypothetical protein [Corynebacterium pilbarense]